MKLITSPDPTPLADVSEDIVVFLAGGITNCWNWQQMAIDDLSNVNATLINPRRGYWDMDASQTSMAIQQIGWEHTWLKRADIIMFWFPADSICPISLLELGAELAGKKPLAIGTNAHYARKLDVVVQTRLRRPKLTVYNSLEKVTDQVARLIKEKS